jgi:hypothetical protein
LEGRKVISIREILSDLLKIEPGRQEKSQQMRVADCLRRLGWKRSFEFYKNKRQWVWAAPDDPPDPPRSTFTNEVDQPSNLQPVGVTANPDPPDPPPTQHLEKSSITNGHHPHPATFGTFAQIGGSGGSEVDIERGLARSTSDPPPQFRLEVDRETKNLNSGVRDIW